MCTICARLDETIKKGIVWNEMVQIQYLFNNNINIKIYITKMIEQKGKLLGVKERGFQMFIKSLK